MERFTGKPPSADLAPAVAVGEGGSARVRSRQQGPHERLEEHVWRHLESTWRSPVHAPTREAFDALGGLLGNDDFEHLVLDSGCGTGTSTRRLATLLPHCVVIGIDRSQSRLTRTGARRFPFREGNCLFVRAELASFWRLARAAGWRLSRHYLLYPNPWPKPAHLGRRWHAHPVFPDFCALGGRVEMRCNWEIYAREFAAAVTLVTGRAVNAEACEPTEPLSPFEAKYAASGHQLFRVTVSLPAKTIPLPSI